jgi:hypothetical protein
MNWIQFGDNERVELLTDFTYVGPLKGKKYHTIWSNYSHHSIKVRVEKNLKFIKGEVGKDSIFYKFNDEYYSSKFEVIEMRILSSTPNYDILKLIVQDLEIEELPLQIQRDLKLSEIF